MKQKQVKLQESQQTQTLSPEERHKICVEFNGTAADYPRDKTIHRLFEEQVDRTPDRTALTEPGGRTLSYRELDRTANRLANRIGEKGLQPGDIIGVLTEGSIQMVAGILAVIKAGCAYLPIDPGYPEKRIVSILEDSAARLLLTRERIVKTMASGKRRNAENGGGPPWDAAAGELVIGGGNVGRGYLNRPELTAEKYPGVNYITPAPAFPPGVHHPPSSRLYRTGDLARWLPDGNIQFLGRIDHQVKLRGFRIEPGEIEHRLSKHGGIDETLVTALDGPGGVKCLCAYYTAKENAPGESLTVPVLREFLGKTLPGYMAPSFFIRLEKFPLTPNGKIDRKALPEPGGTADTGVTYVAPGTGTESVIAGVWKEVLGLGRVGADDNFFDTGGHSLLLMQAGALLNERLNRDIPMVQLYNYPTIRKLAGFLSGGAAGPSPRMEPAEERRGTGGDEIAVIGMAGRFPGAANIDEFWENLEKGVESITFFSDAELEEAGVPRQLLDNPDYVKARGMLEGYDRFDAAFFGYSRGEVEAWTHRCVFSSNAPTMPWNMPAAAMTTTSAAWAFTAALPAARDFTSPMFPY